MDIEVRALERAAAMGYGVNPSGSTDFPAVASGDVYDDRGHKLPGYQRIYREDSGDVLAIHTDTYHLRPYGESFRQLEAAIAETSLDQRGLMSKTEFTHNGARCFRSYLFPHVGIQAGAGDIISLQILAFDSYDGSYSTSIAAGGYRYVCLNGSFFGRTIQQLKVRHVRGASARFENALDKVVEAAERFVEMEPRIRAWKQTPVDVHTLKGVLQAMPQITDRLSDYFISRFATEAEENTLYGAWNIMTAWASAEEGRAQSRTDRDRRVAGLIESRDWRRLENV